MFKNKKMQERICTLEIQIHDLEIITGYKLEKEKYFVNIPRFEFRKKNLVEEVKELHLLQDKLEKLSKALGYKWINKKEEIKDWVKIEPIAKSYKEAIKQEFHI